MNRETREALSFLKLRTSKAIHGGNTIDDFENWRIVAIIVLVIAFSLGSAFNSESIFFLALSSGMYGLLRVMAELEKCPNCSSSSFSRSKSTIIGVHTGINRKEGVYKYNKYNNIYSCRSCCYEESRIEDILTNEDKGGHTFWLDAQRWIITSPIVHKTIAALGIFFVTISGYQEIKSKLFGDSSTQSVNSQIYTENVLPLTQEQQDQKQTNQQYSEQDSSESSYISIKTPNQGEIQNESDSHAPSPINTEKDSYNSDRASKSNANETNTEATDDIDKNQSKTLSGTQDSNTNEYETPNSNHNEIKAAILENEENTSDKQLKTLESSADKIPMMDDNRGLNRNEADNSYPTSMTTPPSDDPQPRGTIEREKDSQGIKDQIDPSQKESKPTGNIDFSKKSSHDLISSMITISGDDTISIENKNKNLSLITEELRTRTPTKTKNKQSRSLNDKAIRDIRLSDYSSAIPVLLKAIELNQTDPEVLDNLAYAYLKTGKYADSVKYLYRSLIISPIRATAWSSLAECYANIGNKEYSVAAFKNTFIYSKSRFNTRDKLQELNLTESNKDLSDARISAIKWAEDNFDLAPIKK
jgi:hypothetical protein